MALRQSLATLGFGRLILVSFALLGLSAIAILESGSRSRLGEGRGHDELHERDLALGAQQLLEQDSVLIVARVLPSRLREALRDLHARRDSGSRRLEHANIAFERALQRAQFDRRLAHVLAWLGYTGVALVAALWILRWLAVRTRG